MRRRALLSAGALAGTALAAPGLGAQEAWPTRPVRIIVPFGPGGSADVLGRLVARELQAALGQPFVVENRAGAGGVVGSLAVARAAPDGTTFVVSGIASHAVAPATAQVEYDPARDFTHVAFLGGPPTILVVGPRLAGVADLGAYAAQLRGGRALSFGTSGAGTHGHLIGELFARQAGGRLEHVPYPGTGGVIADLLNGTLESSFTTPSSVAGPIAAGQLRALAITTAERHPSFPAVPTFREAGFPELVAVTWFGLSGPAGLPAAVVERLNREVVRAMAQPAVRQRLEADAMVAPAMTPPEFAAFIAAERDRWGPLARQVAAEGR